jgi:hypothetical protein
MRTVILWTAAVLLLSITLAVPNKTDPKVCPYRPCPSSSAPGMIPPTFEMYKCGKGGFVRCGALPGGDGELASQCSCPSPEICFSRLDNTFLSNTSKYWDIGRSPSVPITGPSSGYCTGKPCDDDTPSSGTCRTTPGVWAQKCVRKVLRWDGDKPVGSSKGYCLEDYDRMRCGGNPGGVSSEPCPKGWSCVKDIGSPSQLGYCSPGSLKWV